MPHLHGNSTQAHSYTLRSPLLVLPPNPAGSASTSGSDQINNFSHARFAKADSSYPQSGPYWLETKSQSEKKEAFRHDLDPS